MTETYHPSRLALQQMNDRYFDVGEGHEEQVVMSAVGEMLKRARESHAISIETVAARLNKKPEYVARAEMGAILPTVFFNILPTWAEAVQLSYQSIQSEIQQVQIAIDPRHIAEIIAKAQRYNSQDLETWITFESE